MKHIFPYLFFYLFLLSHNTFGQSKVIDSLKSIKITNERQYLMILVQLCWEYRNIQSDTAIKYGKQAIILTKTVKSDSLAAKANMYVGFITSWQGNYALGLEYCQKSLKIAQNANDNEQIGYALHNIGDIYLQKGDPIQTIYFAERAIIYFEKINNQRGSSYCYLTLGTAYIKIGKYDKALDFLFKGQKNRKEAKDINIYALITEQIGKAYLLKKDISQADKYLFESQKLFLANSNHRRLCRLFRELAELKNLQKQTDSAFYYAHKSFKLADSLHTNLAVKESSQLLMELYENQGNYKQAFYYQRIQMLYQDSLQNEKQQRKFYAQEQDYKTKEQEMEAELLKLENKQHNLVQKMLISGIILCLIMLFLLFRNNQFRKKTNIILESKKQKIEKQSQFLEQQTQYLNETNQSLLQLNEEIRTQAETLHEINHTKDKLFSIIGHDLRSPINSLKGFLDLLASDNVTQDEFMMFVPSFQKNIDNVHETLENLLQWSKTQMGGVQIIPQNNNLFAIIESRLSLFEASAANKNIRLVSHISQQITVFVDENHLKIILQNLLSNAIKFTPTNGNVTISAQIIDNLVEIAVSDTGIGMTDDQKDKLFGITSHFTTYGTNGEKGTGLGLLLCKEFVEKNGGKIWIESTLNEGTTFKFTLPKR